MEQWIELQRGVRVWVLILVCLLFSWIAFADYASLFSISPDHHESANALYEESKTYVRDCASRSVGSVQVDEYRKFPCSKSEVNFVHPKYRLHVEGDDIRIELNVRYQIVFPASHQRDVVFEHLKNCRAKTVELYEKSGLKLDLRMDRSDIPTLDEPDFDVKVSVRYDSQGNRVNRSTYSQLDYMASGPNDDGVNTDKFCKVYAHEVGHLLGLEDEYRDLNCPLRERPANVAREYPYSIMSEMSRPWLDLSLRLRHIKRILEPLCGESDKSRN